MLVTSLLGKTLQEAKDLINNGIFDGYKVSYVKILSPKEDIIGTDERIIKVLKKDEIVIYYSLF